MAFCRSFYDCFRFRLYGVWLKYLKYQGKLETGLSSLRLRVQQCGLIVTQIAEYTGCYRNP